ncbi:hypothetical protein NKJ40_07140 [Mesorhizobium sp. M0119]|uniref:hypothetical protein n=1 Tax=Mesorhizobium sp. M0119 TaxID=2956885 RepID=UPI003336F80C
MRASIAVSTCLLGSVTEISAADVCLPNHISGTAAGKLEITQFAAVRNLGRRNCPQQSDYLGGEFSLPLNAPLFVWFRLEGDLSYLDTAAAKAQFKVQLWREGDDSSSNGFLRIDSDRLNISTVKSEAEGNTPNNFDWRFHVQFLTRMRPGLYTLVLSQGDRLICLSSGPPCSVAFRVATE